MREIVECRSIYGIKKDKKKKKKMGWFEAALCLVIVAQS